MYLCMHHIKLTHNKMINNKRIKNTTVGYYQCICYRVPTLSDVAFKL